VTVDATMLLYKFEILIYEMEQIPVLPVFIYTFCR